MQKTFKSKFNFREQSFFNVKFHKTDNTFNGGTFKADFGTSKPEDIYYDEIIIYDGGGVDGYGDKD